MQKILDTIKVENQSEAINKKITLPRKLFLQFVT